MSIDYRVAELPGDAALTALHRAAFGGSGQEGPVIPWSARLNRHSLTWVTACDREVLVGFVNVIGDGGAHGVLLDTVVAPGVQGRGIGRELVALAVRAAREAGCAWVHVDYEPALTGFYERACGFRPTAAGLLALTGPGAAPGSSEGSLPP